MNQRDKEYLGAVIDQLVDIQSQSPISATYVAGRTVNSISTRIQDVIDTLNDWLNGRDRDDTELVESEQKHGRSNS